MTDQVSTFNKKKHSAYLTRCLQRHRPLTSVSPNSTQLLRMCFRSLHQLRVCSMTDQVSTFNKKNTARTSPGAYNDTGLSRQCHPTQLNFCACASEACTGSESAP